MLLFLSSVASILDTDDGRESERKWVRRVGMRVGRRQNQWAESSVKTAPLDGMPCDMLINAALESERNTTYIFHNEIIG